ncbi:hypothetical protein BKA93DRAFT_763296 [Sparassis latifolia]
MRFERIFAGRSIIPLRFPFDISILNFLGGGEASKCVHSWWIATMDGWQSTVGGSTPVLVRMPLGHLCEFSAYPIGETQPSSPNP